jgi:hypothetical protein
VKPTDKIIAACRQALDWHQEYTDRRTLCEQWMVTFARTVASNKRPATIMRVNRWFENHEHLRGTDGFFATSEPTAERIAWEMLGGDDGKAWAATYVRNHNEEEAADESTGDGLLRLDAEADQRDTALAIVEGRRPLPTFQQRPLVADEWASVATFNEFEGRRPEWAGVLTLEEIETSDRRLIRAGALTWRDLPITLQDQLLSQPGHDGAVAAGPITNIFRDGNEIRGEGFFDSGEDGQNARRRMSEGTKQGVSVDLTEVVLDLPDDPDELIEILLGDGLLVILAARIGAATLVSIPAFEGARLQIVGDVSEIQPDALVASAGALPSDLKLTVIIPIETIEAGFVASGPDGQEHVEQIQWASISELAEGQYPDETGDDLAAHLVEIPADDDELQAEVEAALADARAGRPVLIWYEQAASTGPDGVTTSLGWRATDVGPGLTAGEIMEQYGHYLHVDTDGTRQEGLLIRNDEGEPVTEMAPKGGIRYLDDSDDPVVAAGGACPPLEWFEAAHYDRPTPFEIGEPDDNGFRQIHGHIAMWGSCHIGFSGRCVEVPRGLDYDSFQGPQVAGEVLCDDGSRVKAGPIVMDTVHPSLRAKASDAAAHYADTGSLVAQARLFEDAHGLQLRGWIMPGVTDEQLVKLRAADLSPDWRPRATATGGRGVVGVLAVPVSGFNLGLVASGGPELDDSTVPVDDQAIVGTNWTPALSALAARKVAALSALDQPVPEHLGRLAAATESPVLTARKEAVLARLAGESCDCGGSCCSG